MTTSTITPTELAAKAQISVPYASQILSGDRTPARKMAFSIHEATGLKFGALQDLSDSDISVLRKMGQAA